MDIKQIIEAVVAGKLDETTAALKSELTARAQGLVGSGMQSIKDSIFESKFYNADEVKSKEISSGSADHAKASATIVPHGNAPHVDQPEPTIPEVKKVPGASTTDTVPGYKAPKVNDNVAKEPDVKKVPGASTTDKAPGYKSVQ